MIMSGCDAHRRDGGRRAHRRAAGRDRHRRASARSPSPSARALGPEHAMNPRELAACAEAAMMTAKAQGKNRVVLYDEKAAPSAPTRRCSSRDVRSLAHMKMLQSLTGKLNRLNDVRKIGDEIAVGAAVADRLPQLPRLRRRRRRARAGRIPRRAGREHRRAADRAAAHPGRRRRHRPCAERGESLLIGDAANCEFGHRINGHRRSSRSRSLAVPLRYGAEVVGVIVVSKLGLDQFDEDDVRLLEVLAGHAAVAVENATPVRVGAPRGGERDRTARVQPRARVVAEPRRHPPARRRAHVGAARLAAHVHLARGRERLRRVACAVRTPTRERANVAARRFDIAKMARLPEDGEPFVLTAERIASIVDDPLDSTSAVCDRTARRRRAARLHRGVPAAGRALRRPRAAPVRRPRAPGEARDRERVELRGARADVRFDGGGARERARGERRVHVHARALDLRSLAPRRQRARPERRRPEAARARRAAARHRQDRRAERDPRRSPAA